MAGANGLRLVEIRHRSSHTPDPVIPACRQRQLVKRPIDEQPGFPMPVQFVELPSTQQPIDATTVDLASPGGHHPGGHHL